MKAIVFITSSRVKLMHARHLAEALHIEVLSKKYYGAAYQEPRSISREELLMKSYENALDRWRKTSGNSPGFFFIEDTSVAIDVLSQEQEFPGVDVKFWMKDATFADLDADLRRLGNNRAVTVRSDVILHLPDWFRKDHGMDQHFLQFTGSQSGAIVDEERLLETNVLYPWLDNRSFNKWFVPEGCSEPFSALPIEVADKCDFRRESIGRMFEFLEDKNAFIERRRQKPGDSTRFLPNFFPPLLLVTGLPCSGKTTLGTHLSDKYGYYHLEASDFMKRAFYERHGYGSNLSVEQFAEKLLQIDPSVVVSPVLREIGRSRADLLVVTGFRSPQEIDIFLQEYNGPSQIMCWFVDAAQGIRFERSCARGRSDAVATFTKFKNRDKVQLGMGLAEIKKRFSDSLVLNEETVDDYLASCVSALNAPQLDICLPMPTELSSRPVSLEEAILLGLAVIERDGIKSLTTTEIANHLNALFGESDLETNKNNVSRYFNFKPSAYYQATLVDGVMKFCLSATGRSRAMRLAANYQRETKLDHSAI